MAGFFTDYLNNKILDHIFGSAAFVVPPTLYVGLSRCLANNVGLYDEPADGGYARSAMINDLISFPPAVGGLKANAMAVMFSAPSGDWGRIQSVFVADAPTGGNLIAMSDLRKPVVINIGTSPVVINPHALCFQSPVPGGG